MPTFVPMSAEISIDAELDRRRALILQLVAEYHDLAFPPPAFIPGWSPVPVSGRVFDAAELQLLVDSGLEFWLTTGRYAAAFERDFARFFGLRHSLLVNSGSSANLLALTALTSPRLRDRRLRPGDEVITVAAGFPTTVNPIVQNGLVPVFVDVTLPTYNIDVSQLDAALSDRTRAIMVAHTLGNPFDVEAVKAFADAHGLWLVEDCCDAVGSTVDGRHVGTFGDLATTSFYPAHHITMGEGGVRAHEPPAAEQAGRVVPRLGTRLLVRARSCGHVRQALRVAARRPARAATTTSTRTRTSATT